MPNRRSTHNDTVGSRFLIVAETNGTWLPADDESGWPEGEVGDGVEEKVGDGVEEEKVGDGVEEKVGGGNAFA